MDTLYAVLLVLWTIVTLLIWYVRNRDALKQRERTLTSEMLDEEAGHEVEEGAYGCNDYGR